MNFRSYAWCGVVVVYALTMTGCYQFTPVPVTQPPPGEAVRFVLSEPQDVSLGEVMVRDASVIRGQLMQSTDDTLEVFVERIQNANGNIFLGGDVFTVSPLDLSSFEARTLQTGKTVGAVVGLVAAFTGIFLTIFGRENKGGENGDGSPVDTPMFSIPLPIG